MRRIRTGLVLLSAAGMLGAAALAETKVEVTNVHLCCPGCVKAVGSALKGVEGVTGVCNQKTKTVTITAPDDATAPKVPGVTGDTAQPKGDTFEVTGDYEATELIRALHEAGFHVKVKK